MENLLKFIKLQGFTKKSCKHDVISKIPLYDKCTFIVKTTRSQCILAVDIKYKYKYYLTSKSLLDFILSYVLFGMTPMQRTQSFLFRKLETPDN